MSDSTSLVSKTYVAAHMPLLLATRGLHCAGWILGNLFSEAFVEFDALVGGISERLPDINSRFLQYVPDPGETQARNTELFLAGWSSARQQCEAYYIRTGDERDGWHLPFRLVEIDGLFGGPRVALDFDFDGGPDHMVALMEAQRCEYPDVIGGFCQMTTLTRDAVTQRILRQWPVQF